MLFVRIILQNKTAWVWWWGGVRKGGEGERWVMVGGEGSGYAVLLLAAEFCHKDKYADNKTDPVQCNLLHHSTYAFLKKKKTDPVRSAVTE